MSDHTRPLKRALPLAAAVTLALGCNPSSPPPPHAADAGPAQAQTTDAGTAPAAHTGVGHEASAHRAVEAIKELETTRDVTCWTSFRQLDFFVATRQVSDYATLTKIAAVKSMTRALWRKASATAQGPEVTPAELEGAATLESVAIPEDRRAALGEQAEALGMKAFTDYRKTSEHWRVVLSVIQDELRAPTGLKPLSGPAGEALADKATQLSLELLVVSGEQATVAHSPFIEAPHVRAAYEKMAERYDLKIDPKADAGAKAAGGVEALKGVTGQLIEAKIAALRHYNKSSGTIAGDLQRISKIPLDPEAVEILVDEVRLFARFIAEGREPMRSDNFLAGNIAPGDQGPGRDYIDAIYAENAVMQTFPHLMMANGDILLRFEPNPGTLQPEDAEGQEFRLLDHQMNAVRDTAVHWLVLEDIFKDKAFAMDPFAAEYLSEVASMVMTLYMRRAQTLTRQMNKERMDVEVARRVKNPRFIMVPPREPEAPEWDDEKKAWKEKLMASYPAPRFEDATAAAGLPTNAPDAEAAPTLDDIQKVMGAGIAVGDLNGDGWPDLFINGEGMGRLYLNKGKAAPGQFTDATAAWGVPEGLDDGRGALFVDFDGDKDLDLLVLRSRAESLLLENTGGKFTDAAARLGFKPGHGAHVASVFDYDKDGDLDIYVGYYGSAACNQGACPERNLPSLDGFNGSPNTLWQRQADGTYKEVAAAAGIANTGWTLALGAFDHDGDGDLDLYLANDFGANFLYQNQGDGTFKDLSALTGTADRGSGMNVSFTDVNGDGQWDFYLTNIDMFSKNIKVVFPTDEKTINLDDATLKSFRYISGNKLYVRQPDGAYASQEQERFEPGDRGWSWAGVFFDYDLDGDEDMYLSNGWIERSYAHNQKNQLFIQDQGRFALAPEDGAETFAGDSRAAVAADLDLDGDLDLVVGNFRQAPRVLKNTQQAGHQWLGLRLVGQAPNTRAVGAEISVEFEGRTARRMITCGEGYLGQQDERLRVGLGKATAAVVVVRWPNGATERFEGLAAGREHTLTQK